MGLILSEGALSENQKKAAQLMGISEAEMYERLLKLQPGYIYTVSVIIPVYNGEKYIEECINSVKNQTEKNIEIIVVNDGSTDKTHSICKGINDITYLVKPNGGTASALNSGIRQAKCKWIHWLSADDVLYPTAIETMLKDISITPNNHNYIYYTNYDVIDSNGVFIREFLEPLNRNFKSKEERFRELLGNFYGNGSSSMIHKSVFDKIQFDETIPYFEDYDFWLHAMSIGMDLKLIPVKTLKYRNHSEQMTKKVDLKYQQIIRDRYV